MAKRQNRLAPIQHEILEAHTERGEKLRILTVLDEYTRECLESFKRTFRSECLDRWLFVNGAEAQIMIEQWRQAYNQRRPPSSRGYLPPAAFAEQVRRWGQVNFY